MFWIAKNKFNYIICYNNKILYYMDDKDNVISDDFNFSLDESVFKITKKNNETEKMFLFRKQIYNEVLKHTNSCEKAKIYSNIIVNKLSLQCNYNEDVNQLVKKYFDEAYKNNIYN